jgi:hypothetical protein
MMHFFGILFWFAVLWFGFRMLRSRQGCGMRNPSRERDLGRQDRTDEQQAYIDSLESRVAELEERLDFTERLIAGGRQA